MTTDALALLVAIAVPVASLAMLVALIGSVRELERWRDDSGRDSARR